MADLFFSKLNNLFVWCLQLLKNICPLLLIINALKTNTSYILPNPYHYVCMIDQLSLSINSLECLKSTRLVAIIFAKQMKKGLRGSWTYCSICYSVFSIEDHASCAFKKLVLQLVLWVIKTKSRDSSIIFDRGKDIDISLKSPVRCKHGIQVILSTLVERYPIIRKYAVWSIMLAIILHSYHVYSCIG